MAERRESHGFKPLVALDARGGDRAQRPTPSPPRMIGSHEEKHQEDHDQ